LLLTRDDAGDVFLQFVVVFGANEVLSAFNGKHDVDIIWVYVLAMPEDEAPA